MLLRKADATEIDRIMEILADGRRTLSAAGVDQWQVGYPYRDMVEEDVAEGESYVVEDGGQALVATAMLTLRGEPDYLTLTGGHWLTTCPAEQPTYAVVHRIAVDRGHKGEGIATFILEGLEGIAAAQGCESVRIDTHADNLAMLGLIAKEGYTPCGTIHVYHAGESSSSRQAFEKLLG